MPTLEAIKFDKVHRTLRVLDQLRIPFQEKFIDVNSIDDGYSVIKRMQVRGAPAIAIVGALSIVVELTNVMKFSQVFYDVNDLEYFKKAVISRIEYLVTSRPTAVNLSNATGDILRIISDYSGPIEGLIDAIFDYSVKLFEDDLKNNYKIGDNGAEYILKDLKHQGHTGAFSVITICNTGSLATSGHGTALGVIRSLWKRSDPLSEAYMSHVFPLETRPYNQGSRLTAFELDYEKIPSTLISDGMVSYLIELTSKGKLKHYGPVKYIIVGADRIVANGDTANKIGTLQLATLASILPGIKFLVAAPTTTIDFTKESGDEIFVEERPANEFKSVLGAVEDGSAGEPAMKRVQIVAPGIDVWNPSFDVTPHELIDGIVTENEVVVKRNGSINLR